MYKLPIINYSYSDLEPYIDSKTMKIHHTMHHAGYIDKLNEALRSSNYLEDLEIFDIQELVNFLKKTHFKDTTLRNKIMNNAGGHINHTHFWQILGPSIGNDKDLEVFAVLKEKFGSIEKFKEEFKTCAMGRFGSGWAWLCKKNSKLEIFSTANQEIPQLSGYEVMLGIDVWEHAYYLKYQNRRSDYIEAFWNVVDWLRVDSNFKKSNNNEV